MGRESPPRGHAERLSGSQRVIALETWVKNDYAQSGGSRNHFLPAGRRFGGGRAGLIFFKRLL